MSWMEELERLAALHKAGTITDTEFSEQKARLLAGPQPAPRAAADFSPMSLASLDEKWQRRIAFFSEHGPPFSKRAGEALSGLSNKERMLILFNGWAFLFGIFYFFFLGIPKRGVGLALVLGLTFVLLQSRGIWTADGSYWTILCECVFALTANYYYYIKVTTGRDSWDPLKDFRPA